MNLKKCFFNRKVRVALLKPNLKVEKKTEENEERPLILRRN